MLQVNPHHAPFSCHLDASLIEAAAHHAEVLRAYSGTDDTNQEQQLFQNLRQLERFLDATPARTLRGTIAKATVTHRLMMADEDRGEQGDDLDRLSWSIVRDLVSVHGKLLEVPGVDDAGHLDADLLGLCRQHALAYVNSDEDVSDEETNRRMEPVHELEAAIFVTEPQTFAGLVAQATVVEAISQNEHARVLAEGIRQLADGTVPRSYLRTPPDDPAFAIIADHRAAGQRWAQDPDSDAAAESEIAAWKCLIEARPSTIEGLKAFTNHLLAWKRATAPDGSQTPLDDADTAILAAIAELAGADEAAGELIAHVAPLWRAGHDTATIAWLLTIDNAGRGVVTEASVATALASYRDGTLEPPPAGDIRAA